MKLKQLLASALFAAMTITAGAKGEITVTTSAQEIAPGETVDVIVSLSQDAEEVRGFQCDFTLPEGLKVVGKPTYNEDRTEGFIATLDIRNNESSRVTFMSLSGDYITETSGELFRFTVKAENENEFAFDIESEISYDGQVVDKETDNVKFTAVAEVIPTYSFSAVESNVTLDGDNATVSIALDNVTPVGALGFDLTLPEGMNVEMKNNKIKLNWSDRVSSPLGLSQNKISDNTIRFILVDVTSSNNGLIAAGSGEIMSFTITPSADLVVNSSIVIDAIQVSDVKGNQQNIEDAIEISVYNKAKADAEAEAARQEAERVAANEAALNEDLNSIKAVEDKLNGVVNGEYADYVDQSAVDALQQQLDALTEAANKAAEAVAAAGQYESVVDADALNAAVDEIANNAQEAEEAARKEAEEAARLEAERVAANEAALNEDLNSIKAVEDKLNGVVNGEYADYVDQSAVDALKQQLAALTEAANKAAEAVAAAGQYESVVDADALNAMNAAIDEIANNAQEAWKAAQVKPGDINGDGKVNVVDLSTVVNYIMDVTPMPEAGSDKFNAADVNQDGAINVGDYQAILNIILGK